MAQISTAEGIANGLTLQHIANNMSSYEPARNAFFVLEISGLDNLLVTNYNGGISDADAADNLYNENQASSAIRLSVSKCPIPGSNIQVNKIRGGNDVITYAGLPEYKNGTITVRDFVGLNTKSILYAWKRLAYNDKTHKGGRMRDYKKTATLLEYTQDFELIRTWTIFGIWCNDINESDFDKEADGTRELTVSLPFDRAIMNDELGEE